VGKFGILASVVTKTETQVAPQAKASMKEGPCLVVVWSEQRTLLGARLSLPDAEEVVLGRGEPAFGPGALNDRRISSKHLRVITSGEKLVVVDLGSKNGSYLDRGRFDEAVLGPGDFLQLGNTFLRYVIEQPFLEADSETFLGGVSARLAALRKQVESTGKHELPVLITGPSGAGKERVAREVHRCSGKRGPFVALNCSTLSPALAESELFGHTKGAFTGATQDSPGLFQKADGGTLFLDEVATLPAPLQPKLLRALQEGKVRRVGESVERDCRPRIACATNEDLQQMVTDGSFREDLYARLHGSTLSAPSLGDRLEDIGWLCATLLERAGFPGLKIAPDLMWALLTAKWALNVRGLEQCILSEASEANEGTLQLGPTIQEFLASQERLTAAKDQSASAAASPRAARKVRVKRPKRAELAAMLDKHGGRVERVADHYGVRRQQIYRWVESLELDLSHYRVD
jgi:DNA-binding NtrC family response regulator